MNTLPFEKPARFETQSAFEDQHSDVGARRAALPSKAVDLQLEPYNGEHHGFSKCDRCVQAQSFPFLLFLKGVYPGDQASVAESQSHVIELDGEPRWRSHYNGAPRSTATTADIAESKKADAVKMDLSGRLIEALEQERARIAREIHDDYNQRLALMAVELDILAQELVSREPKASQALAQVSQVAKDISADLHRLSRQLHPVKLAQLGLIASLQRLCEQTSARSGVLVAFSEDGTPSHLPDGVAVCLYRITQEALQNVMRHSGAKHAHVHVTTELHEVVLTVEDDGQGFLVDMQSETSGLGLLSMRERSHYVGGGFWVESVPGAGSRVVARIPVTSF